VKKILVIDDDIQGNQMICRILKNAGYEVRSAFDGVEGTKLFMQERPDLVITDLFMPEKEGLETIMEMRQTDKKVRIMAITGGAPNMNMADLLDTAEMLGANALMAKPFHMETFLQRVKELLNV